jgi:GTP-binding protein HflX
VRERLRAGSRLRKVVVPSADGEALAWLHSKGEVVEQHTEGLETALEVRLSDADWARFQSQRR